MSREDRKNEAISRMIERQEQLRKKREEKKKLAVLNQGKPGSSRDKPSSGSPSNRKKTMLQQTGMSERKNESSRVQIHILFSDNVRASNASNRYFFERKQTVEERQRQESEDYWSRLAQSQHLAHIMNQRSNNQGQGNDMEYYMNAGTGGNYEADQDYSGSSYLSSASKRQRLDDWGPQSQQNPNKLLMNQQSSMLLPLKTGYSNMWNDPAQSMMGIQQAAIAQALKDHACLEEQSPSQNVMPTPATPFVNPISEEESSATIEPKKIQEEKPVQIKIDTQTLQSKVTASTAADDAQQILELTKTLQNQLTQKLMQAIPAIDVKPEDSISQQKQQL